MWRSENNLRALTCLQVLEINLRPLGKYLYLLIHLGILIQKGAMHKEKQSFSLKIFITFWRGRGREKKHLLLRKNLVCNPGLW